MPTALHLATASLLSELDRLDKDAPLPERVRLLMQDVQSLMEGAAHAPVFRTLYRSRSLMSADGEAYLLAQCRINNRNLGLTGVLIHHDSHFI